MASRVGAIITLSCRLAPLRQTPSGVPRASVTRWRFVPALPRSVGFGPVAEPLFWPGQRRCPSSPASSRFHPPRVGAPGAPDAGGPTRRPPASRADAASNSSRSRSPSRLAASPTGCLSAARTECRSTQLGSRSADGRLSDVGGAAAEAAQSRSRDHRAEADEPSRPTPAHAIRARSVRRSKCGWVALPVEVRIQARHEECHRPESTEHAREHHCYFHWAALSSRSRVINTRSIRSTRVRSESFNPGATREGSDRGRAA